MAVTGALGGQTDLQVAANTLAPYVAVNGSNPAAVVNDAAANYLALAEIS